MRNFYLCDDEVVEVMHLIEDKYNAWHENPLTEEDFEDVKNDIWYEQTGKFNDTQFDILAEIQYDDVFPNV